MASVRSFYLFLVFASLAGCGEAVEPDPACLGEADDAVGWMPAFDASGLGAFFSVWGACHDDVWTVGGQPEVNGGVETGVAVHFDGATWAPWPHLPPSPVLHWVHGAGGEVFFAGEHGHLARVKGGDVEQFDMGLEMPLWGLFAVATDDVWAVGGDPSNPADGGALIHWDGAQWTITETEAVLFKVWGTSSDNLWAVGVGGVILHYDGGAWLPQVSGTTEDLVSLWGRSESDVVAIGGRGQGLGVRWDGSAWSPFELLTPGMSGTWMDSEGVVTAGGSRGTLARIDGAEVVIEDAGTMDLLHGIFGFDGGPRYAVGGSLTRQPPWEGVVLVDP